MTAFPAASAASANARPKPEFTPVIRNTRWAALFIAVHPSIFANATALISAACVEPFNRKNSVQKSTKVRNRTGSSSRCELQDLPAAQTGPIDQFNGTRRTRTPVIDRRNRVFKWQPMLPPDVQDHVP